MCFSIRLYLNCDQAIVKYISLRINIESILIVDKISDLRPELQVLPSPVRPCRSVDWRVQYIKLDTIFDI